MPSVGRYLHQPLEERPFEGRVNRARERGSAVIVFLRSERIAHGIFNPNARTVSGSNTVLPSFLMTTLNPPE